MLCWLQFWRIGRQEAQSNASGSFNRGRGMPASVIQEDQELLFCTGGDETGKFGQGKKKRSDGNAWHQPIERAACVGMSKRIHLEPLVAGLNAHIGALPTQRPNAPQHRLESYPMFIHHPGTQLIAASGIARLKQTQDIGKVFLNKFWSSSSACV